MNTTGTTPDMADLLSHKGLKQVKQVGQDYIQFSREHPIYTGFRFLEFGLDLYKAYKKDDE